MISAAAFPLHALDIHIQGEYNMSISTYTHINGGQMEEVFKALGDPTRLAIVRMLAINGETCVCRIVDELSMGQSAVSHHMAKLKQARLLCSRKEGQWIHYSLNIDAIKGGPLAFLLEVIDAAEKAAEKSNAAAVGSCC